MNLAEKEGNSWGENSNALNLYATQFVSCYEKRQKGRRKLLWI